MKKSDQLWAVWITSSLTCASIVLYILKMHLYGVTEAAVKKNKPPREILNSSNQMGI